MLRLQQILTFEAMPSFQNTYKAPLMVNIRIFDCFKPAL
jgi:hypothetical protein